MRTGERIAERRKLRGWSQTELARAAGVSQATIGKLESGISSGSSHIHRIARELNTTPAYLTGETDIPDPEFVPEVQLTPDEDEMVNLLRSMDAKDRGAFLQLARTIGRTDPPMTLQSPRTDFRHG